jgi:hypothetical protein
MSDFDYSQFEETPPPQGQNNRTFLVIAGILGAVILLALVAMAAYAFLVLPGRNSQLAEKAAIANAANTATVMAATSSALTAMAPTSTPLPLPTDTPTPEPTFTPLPTEEPATATPELGTGGLTEDMAMTATVSALLTQAAGGKPEATEEGDPTVEATALPTTGFADGMGIPSMVGLGVLFIVLIMITRQIRSARSR